MSDNLPKTYKQLDALLTSALDAEKHQIHGRDVDFIREFIENGEYGVAYQHLIGALFEDRLKASEKSEIALNAAADLMNL